MIIPDFKSMPVTHLAMRHQASGIVVFPLEPALVRKHVARCNADICLTVAFRTRPPMQVTHTRN